jgi:hypothetical protein
MYLSNPQRIKKVLLHLANRPSDLPFYLKNSLGSQSPLDLQLPWWSLSSIRYVEKKVTDSSKVFEWGSGGSTLFLGKKFHSVNSIEHDTKWFEEVNLKVSQSKLASIQLKLAEINLDNQEAFEGCEYLRALDHEVDFVVVDGEDHFGPDSKWSARTTCFLQAQKFISKGGIILVDDSWRYPEIRILSKAKNLEVHEGIGPCRTGVTSTDLHFY